MGLSRLMLQILKGRLWGSIKIYCEKWMRTSPEEMLITDQLSSDQHSALIAPVTSSEIKEAMFSLKRNKAPGPDGYPADFFKKTWDIVGQDVIATILNFFHSGKLLKSVNVTAITLIPKIANANKVIDFRPISCFSTLYKFISKILANRLKVCLPSLISLKQTAFVQERKIVGKVMLAQEIIRGCHRNIWLLVVL